ncbi:MAG: glycosyltransferase [Candidatus Omnitrophica bacterium]|nr:glycosyltransferase [Candidatus Omnitrophota bacterium]
MIVSMCAGWGIERDGIADYSRYLVDGIRSSGVDARIVPLGHYIGGRRYYAQAALKAAGADICHVQFNYLYFNGELPYKNRFLYFAGRVSIPLVMTVHEVRVGFRRLSAEFSSRASKLAYNALLPALNPWSVSLHERIYARAGRVIVHTEEHAKAIRALTERPDKVVLVPHGIPQISDSDRGVSRPGAKKRLGLEGKRVLTIPGFINKRKGYEKVLDILASLPEDVVLMIAGGRMTENTGEIEYYKTVEKIISARSLRSRVRITGYLGERDIPDIMAATDICLAPFSSTAASGALSLSIGYHKPIIASDIAAHNEINGRIPCLELFKGGDEADLLRKIKTLLADSGRLMMLSDMARRYSDEYSYSKTAKRTIELYKEAVER